MTIRELIEINNEMLKEQKYWLNHFKYMQNTRDSDDYKTAKKETKKCFDYLKKVDEMIHLLDTLIQCTHISKRRTKAFNVRTNKIGTALDYQINSTHVTKEEYHQVKRIINEIQKAFNLLDGGI